MKKVTYAKFKKDHCKYCVYNKICTKEMEQDCARTDKEIINKMATMIYDKPTTVEN